MCINSLIHLSPLIVDAHAKKAVLEIIVNNRRFHLREMAGHCIRNWRHAMKLESFSTFKQGSRMDWFSILDPTRLKPFTRFSKVISIVIACKIIVWYYIRENTFTSCLFFHYRFRSLESGKWNSYFTCWLRFRNTANRTFSLQSRR